MENTIPVIIPYYKNQDYLDRCIAHLDKQSIKTEIFVRDNSIENVHFTRAINEGIRKYLNHPCEYILILNQDMYLEPDAIETMLRFMESNQRCGICSPLQLSLKNSDFVIFGGGEDVFPVGKHSHGWLSEFDENKKVKWTNGTCMMLKKKMIREIGLLDENFVFLASDSDYCFTARARGWEIWIVVGARGIHQQGESGNIAEVNLELLKVSDMYYFGKKWLTCLLYSELTSSGNYSDPRNISDIMSTLLDTKIELESLSRHYSVSIGTKDPRNIF